jgi:hypothetical protein
MNNQIQCFIIILYLVLSVPTLPGGVFCEDFFDKDLLSNCSMKKTLFRNIYMYIAISHSLHTIHVFSLRDFVNIDLRSNLRHLKKRSHTIYNKIFLPYQYPFVVFPHCGDICFAVVRIPPSIISF